MNVSDRFKILITNLKANKRIKTQKELGTLLGFETESAFSQVVNNKVPFSETLYSRINSLYKDVNIDWLRTGVGEMLNKADDNENSNDKEGMEVLLLPVSAEGGRLDNFSTQVLAEDCETIISPIKGVDFAMTVTGDSMFPEYPSGSRVLVKKINEKAFIDWGRVYVLDTCNGTVIKKIMPSEYEGKIRCESINPEYPPFEVCFDDVFGMYRVLMCMSLK